jgi:HK97 family phage portal protein
MMGFLQRLLGIERRDLPSDPYWSNWAAMRSMGAATADNVLSNLAVAARCVALRSELLASVPLHLFRRLPDGGRERAHDNALHNCIHDMWNPNMSAYEGRELLIRRLDLHGNSFDRIERNQRGQVVALWPLMVGDVQVEQLTNGRLRYKWHNGKRTEILLQEEMLHIRAASRDGIMGQSPISIARGALSLALSHHDTATSLSANALRPSGLLSFPHQILDASQKQAFRDSAAGVAAGPSRAGGLLVIDGGGKYEPLSFSPEDAEFLETRKLANEDVCRIFNVPPTCAGILDKGTYSNVESEGRTLVQNCIGPLAGRIEQAMHRCLLTDVGRRTLYVEHDLAGLLRGDVKSRFESYRIAREIGAMSPNDIRQLENLPAIPDGDGYNQPANWAPLGSAPAEER